MAQLVPTLADLPIRPDEASRAELIDFELDRESEIPLGTQLGWRLRALIARGALSEGDRLPSVRELAAFAAVNVNTVRSVYAALEEDGLLASEHGRGTFVTGAAAQLRRLDEIAGEALAAAAEAVIDPRELAAVLFASARTDDEAPLSPLPSPDATLSPAAQRRILRSQIGRLETELAAYAWDDVRGPSAEPGPLTTRPVPRVASIEELERTRAELIERLARLRGEAQSRAVAEGAARGRIELMVQDPAGHRWEIVTSDDIGEPGCRNYRVVPRFGPLGAIMGWWRVKVSSGCPLAAPA